MRRCSVFALFLLAALGASGQNGAIPPSFFGLHINKGYDSWPAIPFGTLRLWDVGGPDYIWARTQASARVPPISRIWITGCCWRSCTMFAWSLKLPLSFAALFKHPRVRVRGLKESDGGFDMLGTWRNRR
jgi:hypothetical protein